MSATLLVLNSEPVSHRHSAVPILVLMLLPAVRPTHYFRVSQTAIRSVSFIRVPPSDSEMNVVDEGDPVMLLTSAYDGEACIVDLRDVNSPGSIGRERGAGRCLSLCPPLTLTVVSGARLATAFSSQAGGLILSDAQYELNFTGIKPRQWASSTRISSHRGAPWVCQCSQGVATHIS
jgi:hypothetical protein